MLEHKYLELAIHTNIEITSMSDHAPVTMKIMLSELKTDKVTGK